MRNIAIAFAVLTLTAGCEEENNHIKQSVAYQVAQASAQAATPISTSDSAIAHADRLLRKTASQYNISQQQAASGVDAVQKILLKEKHVVSQLDILSAAATYGSVDSELFSKDKKEFASFLSYYAQSVISAQGDPEQASRVMIYMQSTMINLAGNSKKNESRK